MRFFAAPHLTIAWDESARCVVLRWKQVPQGRDFRQGLDDGLQLLRLKRARRWLTDMRDFDILTAEDLEWSSEDWFPRACLAGLRDLAIVSPRDVIPRLFTGKVLRQLRRKFFRVEYFETPGQARAWFRSL